MKPARAAFAEDRLPIDLTGFERRHRGVAAIRTTKRRAQAEATLGEVQSVPNGPANSVVVHPSNQGGVDAALVNQVLDEQTNRVLRKRSDDRSFESETSFQTARHVVLATTFADFEMSGGPNAIVAWIKAQHYFAQAYKVPTARILLLDS